MRFFMRYGFFTRVVAAITLATFVPTSVSATTWAATTATTQAAEPEEDTRPWHEQAYPGRFQLAQAQADTAIPPEEESDKSSVAKVKAEPTVGPVEFLKDEELEAAASRFQVAQADTARQQLPEPFSLAQVGASGNPIERPERAISDPVAAARLADADAIVAAGEPVAAANAYVAILEDYGRATVSVEAYERLNEMGERSVRGEYTPEQVAAYIDALPRWEECRTPEAKYIVFGSVYNQARAAEDRGDSVSATEFWRETLIDSQRFLAEHPDNPLIINTILHSVEASRKLGPQEFHANAAALKQYIATSGFNIGRWFAHGVVAGYRLRYENNPGESYLDYANLRDEFEVSGINEILDDPTVIDSVKAWILYYTGHATYSMGDEENSLPWFQRILDEFGHTGPALPKAAYYIAFATDEINSNDPYKGILAFQAFVDSFPEHYNAPDALLRMAMLYQNFGDYDGAIQVYTEVVDRYPDTTESHSALASIDFIIENQKGRTSRRGVAQSQQLAQACGPMALQHLLATVGVECGLDKLIRSAGTNESGTTMLGLVHAAANLGVPLAGVQVTRLGELTFPSIAYVDGDHFLLLLEKNQDQVTIQDRDQQPEEIPTEDFVKRWSGKALVLESRTLSAQVLGHDQLAAASGGSGGDDEEEGPSGADAECVNNDSTKCKGKGDGDGPPETSTCSTAATSSGKILGPSNGMECVYDPNAPRPEQGDGGNVRSALSCCFLMGQLPFSLGGGWGYGYGGGGGVGGGYGTGGSGGRGGGVNFLIPGAGGEQTSPVGAVAPGLSATVNTLQGGLQLEQSDVAIRSVGGLNLRFQRTYTNSHGYERAYFSVAAPFHNTVGKNWAHNLNIHLRNSTQYSWLVFYDSQGNADYFDRISTTGGVDTYERSSDSASTAELGISVERDQTSGEYVMYFPDGTQYEFSEDQAEYARIESIVALSGDSLDFHYDNTNVSLGRLTKVTAPSGDDRFLQLEYNVDDLIEKVSIKNSTSTVTYTEYEYDGNDHLTKTTRNGATDGIEFSYDYAVAGAYTGWYVSQVDEPNGNTHYFDFEYDNTSWGWQTTKLTVDYPEGNDLEHFRDGTSGNVRVRRLSGTTVLSEMNGTNGPKAYFLSARKYKILGTSNEDEWDYTYANDRDLITITGPDSSTPLLTFEYTSEGRISLARYGNTTSDPTVHWEYPVGSHSPTKFIDAEGAETTYVYDGLGRVTQIIGPAQSGTSGIRYTYDSHGQIVTVLNALNYATIFAYNSHGDLTQTVDAEGNTSTFSYDDLNRVISVTDPRSMVTEFEYADSSCGSCGAGQGALTKVTDANNNEFLYEYDNNGNLITATDPLLNETAYEYDDINRLTKVIPPIGGATTWVYDELGQLSTVADGSGTVTTYEYGHLGLLESVEDAVDLITYTYNVVGQVSTVTDGNAHVWDYDYDAYRRLTAVTDPVSKVVKYAYDKAGRVLSMGAGSAGTIEPTQYYYDNSKALLTRTRFNASSGYDEINYYYDADGKIIGYGDWNGSPSYWYDDAGRLTRLKDYSARNLSYTLDGGGNIVTMNDQHGDITTYTYTDTNRLSTITAPGSKVWTYTYDANDRVSAYSHPNGMETVYGYDAANRLVSIQHKDGSTVVQGFTYSLDNGGNITETTHEDGSLWTYAYDGRYRLTSAVRANAASPNNTIEANYAYTYDDGDNLLTKVMPWEDDFSDGNATGWTTVWGSWDFSNYYAIPAPTGTGCSLVRNIADDDFELSMSYLFEDTDPGTGPHKFNLYVRVEDTNNRIVFQIYSDKVIGTAYDGGGATGLGTVTKTSAEGEWHDIRVVADGDDVQLWWAPRGSGPMEKLFDFTTTETTSSSMTVLSSPGSGIRFDDFRILADDLSRTVTYAYNNANELTAMTDYNGTTSFTYDDWGRTVSKYRGSQVTDYEWAYGDKLTTFTSTFPGEGTVDYDYRGDGLLHTRTAGGTTTRYLWDGTLHIIGEETTGGTRTKTYHHNPGLNWHSMLAEVEGANPASGATHYYTGDVYGSTRGLWDASIDNAGLYEHTPYGGKYASAGPQTLHGFTGQAFDSLTGMNYFPARQYSPGLGRWLSREPLGLDGPNLYHYVFGNPIGAYDFGGFNTVLVGAGIGGMFGGPPGALAGALIGAGIGAAIGLAILENYDDPIGNVLEMGRNLGKRYFGKNPKNPPDNKGKSSPNEPGGGKKFSPLDIGGAIETEPSKGQRILELISDICEYF